MMGVRLSRLPEFFDRWGVAYELVDGWETRSRSSGDFFDVMGVGIHHTASSTTPANDETWCIHNSPDKPIGNGLFLRSGVFRLWSVRATNTMGKGGPYLTHRGTIPKDSGNTRIFAIEATNNGVGEPWTPEQVAGYPRLCAAAIDCINQTTPGAKLDAGDVLAHFEWAPGRKFDPAGNSRWAPDAALWDMNAFRGDVWSHLVVGPDPAPPTTPTPDPPEEDEDMNKGYMARRSYDGALFVVDPWLSHATPWSGSEAAWNELWNTGQFIDSGVNQSMKFPDEVLDYLAGQ